MNLMGIYIRDHILSFSDGSIDSADIRADLNELGIDKI
jgi:hypothetical protein